MKTIWDFWARHYESLWVQRVSLGPTRKEVLRHVPVRSGLVLLDIGCGTGQLRGDLQEHFGSTPFSYTGVDQSAAMVAEARAKTPGGAFVVASAADYAAPPGSCDMIVCMHAFPYFRDQRTVVQGFAKMLKPDGTLILAQASMNTVYDAVVLSGVKLTTTRAHYLGRRRMRALVDPILGVAPEEVRIGSSVLLPSIILFKWTLQGGGRP